MNSKMSAAVGSSPQQNHYKYDARTLDGLGHFLFAFVWQKNANIFEKVMTTNSYLHETRVASEGIIELLNQEKKRLLEKQKSFTLMDNAARDLFEWMKTSGSNSTLLIELSGFEEAKKRFSSEISEITVLHNSLSPTYNALAGALLQIAKQGVSIRYGSLVLCPKGRAIGTNECLKNVIWQGRNQSMHYEEGTYHAPVQTCYSNLESDFGVQFTLGTSNLALITIDLLGWSEYTQYENDMKSLLSV